MYFAPDNIDRSCCSLYIQ